MDKNAMWKWMILVLLVSLSLWSVIPLKEKIKLGLDLQGGVEFIVAVDEDAIEREVRSRPEKLSEDEIKAEIRNSMDGSSERALEVLRNRIDSLGLTEPAIYPGKDERIVIQLPGIDQTTLKKAEEMILKAAFLEFRLVHKESKEMVSKLFERKQAPDGYKIAPNQPGLYIEDGTYTNKRDAVFMEGLKRFAMTDPAYDFLMSKEERNGVTYYEPFFVRRRTRLKGDVLSDARVNFTPTARVAIEFDGDGRKLFEELTTDYCPNGVMNQSPIGRQLAIVLDGRLYSAPSIKEPIVSGRAEITGSFSVQEATLLANVLRSGSLPAPIKIEKRSFVDPSLGKDSIESGIQAITYGAIGILAFMLIYYMVSGVIANLALLLNMILLPLGMICAAGFLSLGMKGAPVGSKISLPVLTLPGIAGILLTIGMAVDANVLIFERIREEFRAGKKFWTAISAGYDRAFVTIMDANITTLLTGAILFRFGSGPIRGFAVTLCAGIIVSMFTALVVTKLFFGVLETTGMLKNLKMLSVVGTTNFDFLGKRMAAAGLSLILIVGSIGMMLSKGDAVLGVELRGGSAMTFRLDGQDGQKVTPDVDAVRATLHDLGVPDALPQYQKEFTQGGDVYLQVRTAMRTMKAGAGDDASDSSADGAAVEKQNLAQVVGAGLAEAFPEAGFVLSNVEEVGSQVGGELKKDAVWAIVLALLAIIIYLTVRFEFGFAVGAIVALTHDVLMTLGIYTLFGRQVSLPIVAALLTIVGYSVNDTIVVFDRIREDLKLVRNKSFKEICNLSINQTLSRTVLTSLTTLITIVMLLVFGGGAINDFALALCIGVLVGTYSSIFVATPVVLAYHRGKAPDLGGTTPAK